MLPIVDKRSINIYVRAEDKMTGKRKEIVNLEI